MERLKVVLLGVVLLLAIAVVYGYVDDGGGEEGAETEVTVAAPPPEAASPGPSGSDSAPSGGDSGDGGDVSAPSGKQGGDSKSGDGDGSGRTAQGDQGGSSSGREEQQSGEKQQGEEAPAAASAPSRAVFVVRVDKICGKVPDKLAKHARQMESGANATDSVEIFRQAAPPALLEAADEIDELKPPAGGAKEAGALVAALERAARKVQAYPSSGINAAQSPFTEFAKLAGQYGLKRCSQF